MAQYYQVTSLEELHKLYPNLQLDNLEGIPCMIQDDQVTQYTDGQGQQVITTIEQTGMQLPQNPTPQCTSQQSQFVVHQPTQYVIQQMDTSESQTSTVQYIQQRQQSASTNEDISMVQYKDQTVSCMGSDIGNDEHSLQQCMVKQESNQQYLPQVQPVLQQPIQIRQQIQAVDVSRNILVLQNQEQQELLLSQNKSQELVSSAPEKQQQQQQQQVSQQQQSQQLQQQQQQQQQHVLIQKHQQQKSQQMVTQKQMIHKSDSSQECAQQQIIQSRLVSQSGGQPQQIIQPLQYFNQVTVIDNFSQPRAVTIEHHQTANDNNMGQQQQIPTQVQQFRPKKSLQKASLPAIIQQPQVLVPQRFEISSPPPLGNSMTQIKKRVSQQDIERSAAPIFIVQKVDSPFLIRQHQTKMRFQSPHSGNEKINENSYQSISTQSEQAERTIQENQQILPPPSVGVQRSEIQQKVNAAGQILQSQPNKCSPESNVNYGQVKIGILEQPFENKPSEQLSKLKICTPLSVRAQVSKIKTVEQQTDAVAGKDKKEGAPQQFARFANSEGQTRPVPGLSCQMQSTVEVQNQIQVASRGHTIRGFAPRGYQFVPRGRGVQLQTSPSRMPSIDRGGISRKLKSRGAGKIGSGAWISAGSDQRQPLIRPGVQQVSQNSAPKSETNQGLNDVVEEARMVVLLINGEKKIVKVPCSQNILLGQLLQQAGLSLTSPTPITVEQIVDSNLDLVKNTPNNQQLPVGFKSLNTTQVVTVPTSPGTPRSVVTTIQQRPRGPLPSQFSAQPSNVNIIRHRLHFVTPRMSSPSFSGLPTITSNTASETTASQSQTTQSSTTPQTPTKEEPRFVSGFMAICPFCGISSLDFNKCIRCRRKLPENVKSQSIFCAKKKKEKAIGGNEKIDESKSDTEEKQSDFSEGKERNTSVQGYDRKKPKPCLKKKKISDEPTEILILSSDDEEESKLKKTGLNTSALSGLKKEPVYTDLSSESEVTNLSKESNLNEDLMKNIQPGSFTTLQCRTIRIGSYKVQPKERIFISSRGIRMVISSLKNESTAVIIPTLDILKVLFHFGKQIPVIFIYPLPKIGLHIRDLLGMDNKVGPYYDPASTQEETHKRITLLLEKVTEDNKIALNKIFGPDKLEELSEKEANEILIRASPVEVHNANLGKPSDGVRKIMVYPPPPEKGGITLNNQDYACLGEDQFLNDVIIDFYLKYLMLKVLTPADQNRTHVFSTFFYKRLTTKPKTLRKNDPENDPKLSPAEKRHMRVKGWTKQVNLFEKDFVIVPINEHSHWFLAIICFPGLTGPVRFSDNTPVEPENIAPKKSSQTVQIGNTTITHIIKTDGNSATNLEMDSASDRDEAEGDQDDLHPSSDDEGNEQMEDEPNTLPTVQIPLLAPTSQSQVIPKDSKLKLAKKKVCKEPIKQPCILIFDSLAGASRVRVVATLRDYLRIEFKKKMGQERDFSKDTIKGAVPKVPQQNNFTDCGLYVLQYVESFFQDPLHDFKLPLKYLQDWFPEDVVSSKRQKLASLIRTLMEEQGIKVEEIGLPTLTFTNGNNTGDEQHRMEDEEVEDEEELNEEEEEILSSRVQMAEYDNEDDEDLNLEEEEEIEDDEEDDEELEFDEDEELEAGEIPRRWFARASGSCSELQSPVTRVYKTNALVEYDPSDSDEDEETLPPNSVVYNKNQTPISAKTSEERVFNESELISSENRKAVPLTEFQDFESQISCTTIERNLDGKNNDSDMVVSEEEVEEEQYSRAADEEEESFDKISDGNTKFITDSFTQSVEKKTCRPNEVLVKDDKTVKVTDIIKKLVNDKNITISRKEDELNSNLFRKHLDVKKFKVKNCDTGEEVDEVASPSPPSKTNLATHKRPYQTLKSVRIPKKTERNLELYSKRQKVDER